MELPPKRGPARAAAENKSVYAPTSLWHALDEIVAAEGYRSRNDLIVSTLEQLVANYRQKHRNPKNPRQAD